MEVGDKIAHDFEITKALHQGFIDLFDDRNPMHTDVDYAQSKGYKSAILHGNILNGFLSYYIGECLPIKNVVIISQKISYHNPFFVGDVIRLDSVVKDVIASVNVVDIKYTFKNESKALIAKGLIQIKILT